MGLERPFKKQSSGLFLGRGRVPFFPNASRRDVGGKKPRGHHHPLDGVIFYELRVMGLERPFKKQSSGLFLGRGRVPFFLNASRRDVGRKKPRGRYHPMDGVIFMGRVMGLEESGPPKAGKGLPHRSALVGQTLVHS